LNSSDRKNAVRQEDDLDEAAPSKLSEVWRSIGWRARKTNGIFYNLFRLHRPFLDSIIKCSAIGLKPCEWTVRGDALPPKMPEGLRTIGVGYGVDGILYMVHLVHLVYFLGRTFKQNATRRVIV
jgi:hypothetical protein